MFSLVIRISNGLHQIPYSLKFLWNVNFVFGLPTKFKTTKSMKCHPVTSYVNCQPRIVLLGADHEKLDPRKFQAILYTMTMPLLK